MPNIVITQRLGRTIQRLKDGWRIDRIRRRTYHYFLWAPEFMRDNGRVEEDLVDELLRLKLVTKEPLNLGLTERYWRYTSHVYRASELCKSLPLPPEEFWVSDEPV
jgi:hypothetical protein